MFTLAKTVCFCCNPHFCEGLARCCGSCLTCGCSRNRPSPVFLIFTVILCGGPAIASLAVAIPNYGECNKNVPLFLLIFAAVDVAYVVFASYLYSKFSRPYDPTRPHEQNPFSRAWHVCCFDPWVSLYIVALIGGIVLASIGLSSMAKADCGVEKEVIPEVARIASGLFFLYLFGGILVIFISLGIECLRRGNTGGVNPGAPAGGGPNQAPGTVDRLQGVIGRLFYPLQGQSTHFAPPAPPPGMPMPGSAPVYAQPYQAYSQQPNAYQAPPDHPAQYHGGTAGQQSSWRDRVRANIPFLSHEQQPVNQGHFQGGLPLPQPPPYAAAATPYPPYPHQSGYSPLNNPVPPLPPPLTGLPPPMYVAKLGGGGDVVGGR